MGNEYILRVEIKPREYGNRTEFFLTHNGETLDLEAREKLPIKIRQEIESIYPVFNNIMFSRAGKNLVKLEAVFSGEDSK
ncbi:hypothetical protein HYT25_02170 [Candidatus Pacearchaeota archaeon]|nr:hypothetical protein [Candidatus Pacearchaeota archaeon]